MEINPHVEGIELLKCMVIPCCVFKSDLNNGNKLLLALLYSHLDRNGYVLMTKSEMMFKTGWSKHVVTKVLIDLLERGLIARTMDNCNMYYFKQHSIYNG